MGTLEIKLFALTKCELPCRRVVNRLVGCLVAIKYFIISAPDFPIFLGKDFPTKEPVGMLEPVPVESLGSSFRVVICSEDLIGVLTCIETDQERVTW